MTFALNPKKGGLDLYELLKEYGLVESEFIVTDKQLEFAEVKDSNGLYTMGKDTQGLTIYRTKDRKFIFEQRLSSESTNE